MGTIALTVFEERGQEICVLYRQMDGYPTGHGAELLEIMKGMEVVDGIPVMAHRSPRIANGMGCLAAQVIAALKTDVGSFYIEAPGTRGIGEEYIYTISTGKDGIESIYLKVEKAYGDTLKEIYNGPINDFDPVKTEEEE
jgi:hypothetical protein